MKMNRLREMWLVVALVLVLVLMFPQILEDEKKTVFVDVADISRREILRKTS